MVALISSEVEIFMIVSETRLIRDIFWDELRDCLAAAAKEVFEVEVWTT